MSRADGKKDMAKSKDTAKTPENEVPAQDVRAADAKVEAFYGEEPAAKPAKRPKVAVDRRARVLRTFSVGSTILFVAIVLVFNILFSSVLGDVLKWDSSQTATYTLDDTTKTIVQGLEDDIRIVGLFERASWPSIYQNYLSYYSVTNSGAQVGETPILLDSYAKLSGGRIAVEYVDPQKVPGIVKELDPDGLLSLSSASAGSYVVTDATTKKSKLVGISEMYAITADQSSYSYYNAGLTAEQAFSGAIQYVASRTTPVVYFVTGHGEAEYTTAYKEFANILKYNNFDTKTLDIRTVTQIPADAAMLAFLEPTIDISAVQRDMLFSYLKGGGRMFLLCGYNTTSYVQFNDLLTEFGIEITNDRVRESDEGLRYGGDPYTFIASVPTSAISTQSYQLILGAARRIAPVQTSVEWLETDKVLLTSAGGISEANGDANAPSEPGAQPLGMSAENSGWQTDKVKSAKVVVLGSSTLISDTALSMLGDYSLYNRQFMYYAMDWLTDASSNSLYIKAKSLPTYTLNAGGGTAFLVTQILVVAVIPLGLLVAAYLVFRRRRHM